MGEWFGDTAFAGSLLLAVPVAALAGLLSFFSPCVVPLLPGYLSYVSGLSAAELAASDAGTRHRGRLLIGALLFVLGFTAVFVSYGTLFGAAGFWLQEYYRPLTIVLGVLVIVMGLVFSGLLPFLQRDVRVHRVPAVGLVAAPLLGVFFGIGWTPCIGPTLAAVLTLSYSASDASAARGALLTAVYCLGLGLPFIVAALALRRFLEATSWLRRHQAWVSALGGGMLVLVGVALLTGWWDVWVVALQQWAAGYELVI
jgi:cytochrome c-type biogenesis protein